MNLGTVLNQLFRPQTYIAQRVAQKPEAIIGAGKALISVINTTGYQIGFNSLDAVKAFNRMQAIPNGSTSVDLAKQALQDIRIIKHDLHAQVRAARKDTTGQDSWYATRLLKLRGLHQQARDVQRLRLGEANDRKLKA